MEIQDLSKAEEMAKENFKKNPKRSLSALFRILRRDDRFSFFGDIPLAFSVIHAATSKNIHPSITQIYRLLKLSEDFKNSSKSGKTKLIKVFGYALKNGQLCKQNGVKINGEVGFSLKMTSISS